jgi:group I intron endonuclease
MPVIYKATNKTNGKVYIGYDSAWPKRKYIHLWEAKSKAQGVVFHQAIKKYGASGFDWTIEYESPDKDFVLNIMEGYFIRLYDSHYSTGKGYNMPYGGEGQLGFRHSPETIARFKRRIPWNRGIKTGPQSPEHVRKVAEVIRGKRDKHWEVTSPAGSTFQITNLKGFCRTNKLNVSHMWSTSRGERRHHKGWKCTEVISVCAILE